ncbi:uncharacterized protein LOC123688515 [Harmonia axyridis]|uniref:uncharacterized protein LOC123688515 n=1 Tax=Harmonia axyridis TaxID=115357 RepID=UPI001E275D8E|nr:uncharacterized protein LOC123688515 [Harmonia axyridis]
MAIRQKVIEWLKEIFVDEDFEELSFEFPKYDQTGGSTSEIISVDVKGLKHVEEKQYNLLIKKGKDNISVLDNLEFRRGYACEVKIYSEIIPIFRKLAEENNCSPFDNIPKCYGTIQRDDLFIVVLKNLKAMNFMVHDILTPNDLIHIELVLQAYAKWHAFNFALKDQKPEIFNEIGKHMKGFESTKMFPVFVKTIEKEIDFVVEFYKDKNEPLIVEKLKNLRKGVEKHFRECLTAKDEKYLVIRHGDCWNNNFLFHYNKEKKPDQVIVIDWQMGLLGSPLADVTQFIFYCSSKCELEHLDELLKFYYGNLSEKLRELGSNPDECFPWKACKKAFKRYAPLAIAGMPVSIRMSYRVQTDECYDIADSIDEGDFSGLFGKGIRDPEEYFERIDGILELCVREDLF